MERKVWGLWCEPQHITKNTHHNNFKIRNFHYLLKNDNNYHFIDKKEKNV